VFQIDTRMAGYQGITAGYLIRGSRPCLVETGTAPSAPVVRAAPSRLLFSHYGPVSDVPATLERSAEELNLWVEYTRAARSAGLDLGHVRTLPIAPGQWRPSGGGRAGPGRPACRAVGRCICGKAGGAVACWYRMVPDGPG
jgi:hypothetical protein